MLKWAFFFILLCPGFALADGSLSLTDLQGNWRLARPGEGEECATWIVISTPARDAIRVRSLRGVKRPEFTVIRVNQGRNYIPSWIPEVSYLTTSTFSDQRIDQDIQTYFSIFAIHQESRDLELYSDNALVIKVSSPILQGQNFRCVYIR